jgi:hypothetical protein
MNATDRLDELVAGLQVVRDEDLLAETRSAASRSLFAQVVAGPGGLPRVRRGPGSRRWLVAVGLATAGAVAAFAIGIGPSPEAVTPAGAALREAAAAARAQDGVPAGKYLYIRSVNASLALGFVDSTHPEGLNSQCCNAFVPHVREVWLGDEPGDARLRERRAGAPQFLSAEERERWIRLGRPELESKTPFSGILAGIRPRDWYHGPLELPSDADAIYEQFKQTAEADTPVPGVPDETRVTWSMFHHFSDVLREARATPEQRAAAYEALARAPGVVLVGDTTDHFGRRGIGVAIDILENEPSGFLYRYVLVFDSATADLLEERREVLPGNRFRDLPAGTVEAYATYEYGVVATLTGGPQ